MSVSKPLSTETVRRHLVLPELLAPSCALKNECSQRKTERRRIRSNNEVLDESKLDATLSADNVSLLEVR